MPAMKPNNTDTPAFQCTYCGEINHIFVDPSQGKTQRYI